MDLLTLVISGASIVAQLPGQPMLVSAPTGNQSACVAMPKGTHVVKVWTFIGSDRGDVLEADIQISSDKLDYFYQRSEHREVPGQYDAWKSEAVDWTGDVLCAQYSANPTGGKPVRVHYQIRLETRKP